MTKLTSPHSQAVFSTELNSLANGSAVESSVAVVDNTTNLDPWGAYNGTFVFAAAPTAGTTLDLYAVPEYDGTDYDTIDSTNVPQPSLFIGSFIVTGTGLTQHLTIDKLSLTPNKWKLVLTNNSGQALAASGSSISLYSWQTQ